MDDTMKKLYDQGGYRFSENSAVLVVVNNPFDISDREIRVVELDAPVNIHFFLMKHAPITEEMEYHVSIDDRVYAPEDLSGQTVAPGSFVAVCPVLRGGGSGKNPLAVLAGVVLSVFSFGIGSMVAGATGALWAGNLAAGLTLMVGGQLIGNAFGPSVNQGDDTESYKWGALQSITSQGAVIPITYGKIRTAGQVLGQHIRTDGDTQYLEMLLCGGEGPIDAFTNVKINDNTADNYQDVILETRPGENEQTVIEGFNDIYVDQFLSYSLESGKDAQGKTQQNLPGEWSTHETDTNLAEGLQIELTFPAGLYDMGNQGNTGERDVVLDVEYGRVGENGVTGWTAWDGIGEGGRIKKNTQKPFAMTFSREHIPPGKYQVRARVLQRRGSMDRGADMLVWSRLVSVICQPLSHPNKVLVGLRIKATGQLSGSLPTVTWEQERSSVLVQDPATGTWTERDARNPAWIVYDMCVRARRLSGDIVVFGERPERIDYPAFLEWSKFCDRTVNGRKAIQMNLLVDSSKSIWDWCQDVAASARGAVLLRGLKISCIWEAAGDPVQLFSSGNIVAGSFKGEYLQLDNRANAVDVSFINESKNYEREQITIDGEGFDEGRTTANPVSVQLTGITDFERAYREGMYRLYQNRYILRTVTFTTDIDSIACQVGDVALVQNDATQWGQGGRVLAVNGSRLTLDVRVKKPAGTARITIRKQGDDKLYEGSVTFIGSGDDYDTIAVGGISGVTPGDVFALGGTERSAKRFRIYEISRDSDLRATITATEYAEEIYNDDFDIPDFSTGGGGEMTGNRIVNLRFQPSGEYRGSAWIAHLWATWSYAGEHPIAHEVEFKYGDEPWFSGGKPTQTTVECPYRDARTTYYVRARALYSQSPPSAWEYASTAGLVIGDGTPPDPPTDLIAQGLNGFAILTWKNPSNPDLHHIEIWVAAADDIEGATRTGQTPAESYTWPQPLGGEFWFWVRAVNNTGQKSGYNAEAGTYCKIEPEGWQVLVDELLKDELIQMALEWFKEPIGEIESLNDRLAEVIIQNNINDFKDFWQGKLKEYNEKRLAEAGIEGTLTEYESLKHVLALVVDEAHKREELGLAFAEKIEGVVAMLGDPDNPGEDTIYAAIMDVMRVMATRDEALSARIADITASIGDPENPAPDSVRGAIHAEQRARAEQGAALTEQIETHASILGDPADPQPGTVFGAIETEARTRAAEDEAEAARREQLQAQLNTEIGAVGAKIQNERNARVNADSALSSSVSTVQTQLNGNIASVQQLMRSVDGLNAQWGFKLNVNGHISGMISINNGSKSTTAFLTDAFYIARPGYPAEPVFAAGYAGGIYRAIMRNAFIEDLSVDTLKIKGNAVTAPSYGSGSATLLGTGGSDTYRNGRMRISGIVARQPLLLIASMHIAGQYGMVDTSVCTVRCNGSTVATLRAPTVVYESGAGNLNGRTAYRNGTCLGIYYPTSAASCSVEVYQRSDMSSSSGWSATLSWQILAIHCKR